MKSYLLNQSLAIRTRVLPEVKNVISRITPDYDGVRPYTTNIVEWLEPVVDLSDFYVYPSNGITEGLNWWSKGTNNNITVAPGEYQWVDSVSHRDARHTTYQSVPSAIDGNIHDIVSGDELVVDLAYVGSTKIKKIVLPTNTSHVFYSFSKSFGIRNVRTGWIFTKYPDHKLDSLVYGAKYYNYYARDIAETIINTFSIDYVHNRLFDEQIRVCNKLDLEPSDSVWLATSAHDDYTKFRRAGNVARLCLAGIYNI